jgi:hypothetical protein
MGAAEAGFGAPDAADAGSSGGALRIGGKRCGGGASVLVVFGIAGVPAAGRIDGASVLGMRPGGESGGTRTAGIPERGVGEVIGAGAARGPGFSAENAELGRFCVDGSGSRGGAGGGNATGVGLRDGMRCGAGGAFGGAFGARI